MPDITREYKLVNVLFIVLILVFLMIPLISQTENMGESVSFPLLGSIPCQIKERTGNLCSSCGLTRSIISLYKGDLAKSQSYHKGGIYLLLLLMVQFCLRFFPVYVDKIWLPWTDIAQIIVFSVVFKISFF